MWLKKGQTYFNPRAILDLFIKTKAFAIVTVGKTNNMQKQDKGIFRIGTSGIVVPGSKQSFPVEFRDKSRLSYYGSLFNTLEVNSTFQKLPMLSTLEKWALDVPEEFQFTIKLWKEITHRKQLIINLENVDSFFNAVQHIGTKKGCLLIQFPGSITSSYSDKVEQILLRLQKLDFHGEWRKAIEFRSADWYTIETALLLSKYAVSMVFHDMPKSNN